MERTLDLPATRTFAVRRPRFWRRGILGPLLVFLFIVVGAPASRPTPSLDARLADVAGGQSFDLAGWEVRTLTDRLGQAMFRPVAPGTSAEVLAYGQLVGEDAQARQARDLLWSKREVTGSAPGLPEAQARLDSLDRRVAASRPIVEATVSAQVEDELRRQGVRRGFITWRDTATFPFRRPEFAPNVFFQLTPLPDLLVVAPPDQIRIVGSVLLDPDLSPAAADRIENGADALGVSSAVTGIGGLAAYPSMLPDSSDVPGLLITVSHEWTHHYLAFRPLGMHYFSSYDMTEINETVADMVGHEVGSAVYERDYATGAAAPGAPSPAPAPARPARPDFWTLMRQIRKTVEAYLARHDVADADAYMAEQRQELARDGYYVPRLNTAYLAFFGSYAGTSNPYEARLRLLRQKSGSLRAFLETISTISQPSDLDRLLAS
jgi:hypothetical protein